MFCNRQSWIVQSTCCANCWIRCCISRIARCNMLSTILWNRIRLCRSVSNLLLICFLPTGNFYDFKSWLRFCYIPTRELGRRCPLNRIRLCRSCLEIFCSLDFSISCLLTAIDRKRKQYIKKGKHLHKRETQTIALWAGYAMRHKIVTISKTHCHHIIKLHAAPKGPWLTCIVFHEFSFLCNNSYLAASNPAPV